MSRRARIAWLGLALALLPACAAIPPLGASEDLPHFLQVDEHLYRAGQPTEAGFRRLADLGIKTVIDLRAEHPKRRRQEQTFVESLGLRWVYLPMHSYWRPSDVQVVTFLKIASDPAQQPVFIHCRQGEDRTGALVAVYRIVKQGWEPQRAYAEARALGLSRWNPLMRYVILHNAKAKYARAVLGP